MSLLSNVPRIMYKDVMRLPAKFGKLGMDVRTTSIYEAGCAKTEGYRDSVSKNINGGVRNYCQNEICLNNQWKQNEEILAKFTSHLNLLMTLIIGSVEKMKPAFSKVTNNEYNMRSQHTIVDKYIEKYKDKSLLDKNKQSYSVSVGGSTGSNGGKVRDTNKIQSNDLNEDITLDIKKLSIAEVKEALQKKQFQNIVETLRKSRPQEADQAKQLTKEQIEQLNYALLCRVYELNVPGAIPPHMQNQELPSTQTAKKPKTYVPPKQIKNPSSQSNCPKPPHDEECNN